MLSSFVFLEIQVYRSYCYDRIDLKVLTGETRLLSRSFIRNVAFDSSAFSLDSEEVGGGCGSGVT